MNTLILCGGTGAHVGLAFARLHVLGEPFGFFLRKDGSPIEFPTIFLIDQDHGIATADDQRTAWQECQTILAGHSARNDWKSIGLRGAPVSKVISPLPVGRDRKFAERPFVDLNTRFGESKLLPLMASNRQRSINYSHGMMASPAVGSLLFRLKHFDADAGGLNNDAEFADLFNRSGRMVVAGSAVGGTGASVAPSLSLELARDGRRQILTVMLLNWFALEEAGDHGRDAQTRNRQMAQNLHSALQFYGSTLAGQVSALPLGVRAKAIQSRQFSGDLLQNKEETFIHALAAISAFSQFSRDERGLDKGLYLLGASSADRFSPEIKLPGGSVFSAIARARLLSSMMQVIGKVLRTDYKKVAPAIFRHVFETGLRPAAVAEILEKDTLAFQANHQELTRILEAPEKKADLDALQQALSELTVDSEMHERLKAYPLELNNIAPEVASTRILRWAAKWIAEELASTTTDTGSGAGGLAPINKEKGRGASTYYLPEPRIESAGGVQLLGVGELTPVQPEKAGHFLEGYIDPTMFSANSWPHSMAAVEHFDTALRFKNHRASRQLQLMLAGWASRRLKLRPVEKIRGATVSLETLLESAGASYPDIMSRVLVQETARGETVPIGFTSPLTLFCPLPSDESSEESIWQALFEDLTGTKTSWDSAGPIQWLDRSTIYRIRYWIDWLKTVHGQDESPVWAQSFSDLAPEPGARTTSFSPSDEKISVFWRRHAKVGSPAEPIALLDVEAADDGHSSESTIGITETTELQGLNITASDRPFGLPNLPQLKSCTTARGEVFEAIEIEIPSRRQKVRVFWEEHLVELQRQNVIAGFREIEGGGLEISVTVDRNVERYRDTEARLITLKKICIPHLTPILQKSSAALDPGDAYLFPDLPLKSDYLDLLMVGEGISIFDLFRSGSLADLEGLRPTEENFEGRSWGRRWKLNLKGRPAGTFFTLTPQRNFGTATPITAQWMVWPNFRCSEAKWQSYYCYDACSVESHRTDVIFLRTELGVSTVERRTSSRNGLNHYPVSEQGGGAPLAFVLLDHNGTRRELGTFLVRLRALSPVDLQAKLAIDFGSSHSAAAVSIRDRVEALSFNSEFDRDVAEAKSLTLQISRDIEKTREIVDKGAWLPTFCFQKSRGYLPSELVLAELKLKAPGSNDLVPGADFFIPSFELGGAKQNCVLAGFKWPTDGLLIGRERELRRSYLRTFLEMALAELLLVHSRGVPKEAIDVTFTYPLRATKIQVQEFTEDIRDLIRLTTLSTGLTLRLQNEIGLYDESRAAGRGTREFAQMIVVADLGGGTLDLFISMKDIGTEKRFRDVADSVKIGGDLLLRLLAHNAMKLLPERDRWRSTQGEEELVLAHLRSWVRDLGSAALFGARASNAPSLPRLKLEGFSRPSEGEPARRVIDRYFDLITEYIARNVVAFLVNEYYPKLTGDDDRLAITLQLRGNGWKLRHQGEDEIAATNSIVQAVRSRFERLWEFVPIAAKAIELPDNPWRNASEYARAAAMVKVASVIEAVGKAQDPGDVIDQWHTYTLIDLEVMIQGQKPLPISWTQPIPFDSRGSSHIEIKRLFPPIEFPDPEWRKNREIADLTLDVRGKIGESLGKGGVILQKLNYLAAIGPEVWEALFHSPEVWTGEPGICSESRG